MHLLVAVLIALAPVPPCTPGKGGAGHAARTQAVRAAFKRAYPCPANGKRAGACPGWVVDHRIALVCCGEDTIRNLQWQTTADAKAKDRTEGNCACSLRA